MENFSFKCSKIVKNALYLKKSVHTVTHECQKVNNYLPKWRWIDQDIHRAARWISWAFTDTEVNSNVNIYPTSELVRNRPFKKNQITKKQSRALSRSLISEYLGYSQISEPITACEKHYSLVGYMLTVDIYFLLSNQSARKVLFTCLANTNNSY